MLVLTRKLNEKILVGNDIHITLIGIRGNQVRLGIEAPADVKVLREELLQTSPVPVGCARLMAPAEAVADSVL